MQVHNLKARGSSRLARTGVELSREARVRLAWMDFYRENYRNFVSLGPNTFHRCRTGPVPLANSSECSLP
jgi:hypothetical protein